MALSRTLIPRLENIEVGTMADVVQNIKMEDIGETNSQLSWDPYSLGDFAAFTISGYHVELLDEDGDREVRIPESGHILSNTFEFSDYPGNHNRLGFTYPFEVKIRIVVYRSDGNTHSQFIIEDIAEIDDPDTIFELFFKWIVKTITNIFRFIFRR